jgi:hypothetical protein
MLLMSAVWSCCTRAHGISVIKTEGISGGRGLTLTPFSRHHPTVVLANAGTHRTLALSNCSMGPRVREDDVDFSADNALCAPISADTVHLPGSI